MRTLEELGPTLCKVARAAIEARLLGAERPVREERPSPRFPVFVTLRTAAGALRGCVGTTRAVEADVIAEAARSAVLAATADPRFAPVALPELPELAIEVSVLMPEQEVTSEADLDPLRYGVVVRSDDGRRGLLLPEVPGVTRGAEQLALAKHKAGIAPDAAVRVYRFEVCKFREPGQRGAH